MLGQYTIAMMGYAPEKETTVIELTYNYGVTEYTKGNAYAQVDLLACIFSPPFNSFVPFLSNVGVLLGEYLPTKSRILFLVLTQGMIIQCSWLSLSSSHFFFLVV